MALQVQKTSAYTEELKPVYSSIPMPHLLLVALAGYMFCQIRKRIPVILPAAPSLLHFYFK
jgi:hypothetical protein